MSTIELDKPEKIGNDQTPTQDLGVGANETDSADSKIESSMAQIEADKPRDFHTLLVSELLRHVSAPK